MRLRLKEIEKMTRTKIYDMHKLKEHPSTNEGEQVPEFLGVVKILIESLKKKKALGSDNITSELLQEVRNTW